MYYTQFINKNNKIREREREWKNWQCPNRQKSLNGVKGENRSSRWNAIVNDNSGIQITWLQTTMLQLVLNNKNTPQIKKSEFKAKNQKGKKPRKKDRIFILALVFFFYVGMVLHSLVQQPLGKHGCWRCCWRRGMKVFQNLVCFVWLVIPMPNIFNFLNGKDQLLYFLSSSVSQCNSYLTPFFIWNLNWSKYFYDVKNQNFIVALLQDIYYYGIV